MKIIIIGCGRTGAGLAEAMSVRGHSVTIVDKEPTAFDRLGPLFKGRAIQGVGFDRGVLIEAGIERSDGLAAVTDSDEVNVVVARLARSYFRVPRVVASLYDPKKAEVYRRLGLQIIAQVTWGINRIAELLCFSQLDVTLSLGDGEIELVEVEIPELLAGRTVQELTIEGEVHVVAINRGGRSFLPTRATLFQKGDMVHLAAVAASVDRLKSMLGLM